VGLSVNIEFSGKTVIVTGAAHGFGREIALRFAERGASVWACDILESGLAETRRLCLAAGGQCEVRTVDVTDRGAVFAFVEEVSRDYANWVTGQVLSIDGGK
jgi:3-oxoacyl-[acyl-carrier protein] reductase